MSIFKPYRFYPKETIERQANDILMRMQQTSNFAPRWPFEASMVADFLDLGVVWDCIPPDSEGAIAARILPWLRQIEINENILDLPAGFIESTIAHEIGHWVLHINHDEADGTVKQLELDLGDSKMTTNRNWRFDQLDHIGILSRALDKKAVVELAGKSNIGGKDAFMIKVKGTGVDDLVTEENIAVDAKTFLIIADEMYSGEELVFQTKINIESTNSTLPADTFTI